MLNSPNQPNPNPIQSVIDRGNLRTQNVYLWRGKTSRLQEIVGKRLQEEFGSSDRTRKPVKYEVNRVMHVHDRTGKPVESSANTHSVQEFGSPEHRDNASSIANKFNLEIDDENIDFNISGVPNAMVKRSHGINVHHLIQKIENHPQRQALQSDLQQHRPFNPFSKESQDVIKAAGNIELCELQSCGEVQHGKFSNTIGQKELGSKVDRQSQEEVARQPREEIARQPRGEVSRQAKFFQPTLTNPKTNL